MKIFRKYNKMHIFDLNFQAFHFHSTPTTNLIQKSRSCLRPNRRKTYPKSQHAKVLIRNQNFPHEQRSNVQNEIQMLVFNSNRNIFKSFQLNHIKTKDFVSNFKYVKINVSFTIQNQI